MTERKIVPLEWEKKRIDEFLSKVFEVTRSQAKKWISGGHVSRDSKIITKAGGIIHQNDEVIVHIPKKQEGNPSKNKPINIVFENDDFLVVKKPAGIPTHPDETYRDDTLSQRVLHHCPLSNIGLPKRPGVVHRLDKDTSGLLIFAKTDAVHLFFTKLFASRKIEKYYIALVHGGGIANSGTIDSPLLRDPSNRKKMIVSTSDKARYAISHFNVVQRAENVALLRVKIETGRTHQIRVHLSAIGHSVVGDATYGNRKLDELLEKKYGEMSRMFLHAESLGFIPPNMQEKMEFSAKIPEDLERFLNLISQKHKIKSQ